MLRPATTTDSSATATASRRAGTPVRWALLGTLMLAVILVPFAVAGARMDAWSLAQLQALADRRAMVALLVVALLAADVLLPVPSSIVATLAGATLGMAAGALATCTGMVAGCVIAYGAGRWAGAPAAARLVGPGEAARLHELSRSHGAWVLVLTRAVPVLAEASTLMAGAARMPFARFLSVTTAANLGIALVYAAVGAFAASVQSFLLAVAGAVLVPLAARIALGRGTRSLPR
jgi:uncharacterized membrane protein YdjX (TVP38/TMEM64 family)